MTLIVVKVAFFLGGGKSYSLFIYLQFDKIRFSTLILLFIVSGAIFLISTSDLVRATVRVYLEILVLLINSEERVKDYRSHSELVTTGGQLACSKRDYEVECSLEPLVLSRDFKPRRVPKSYMENWIRLHCRRLSNLGLITTYSRTEHLLEYLISRLMETSKTAIS